MAPLPTTGSPLVYFEVTGPVRVKNRNGTADHLVPSHMYQLSRAGFSDLKHQLGDKLMNMTPKLIYAEVRTILQKGLLWTPPA